MAGSGGSIQQQMLAQNYPGLLDGLMPAASFPDSAQAKNPDCRLLQAYFATPVGAALTNAEMAAITGLTERAAGLRLERDRRRRGERLGGLRRDGRAARADLRPGDEPQRDPLHDLGQHGQRLRP